MTNHQRDRGHYSTPVTAIGPERGTRVKSIFEERGEGNPIPTVWSSGDIADAAGVNPNSVNDWVRRNAGPFPAFISRKGSAFWTEEVALQIVAGFEERRKFREERAALPRNAHGAVLLSQLTDEQRAKFGYKPRPPRKLAKPSRAKAALAARAANPDAPLPRAPKRKLYAPGEERPKRPSGGAREKARKLAGRPKPPPRPQPHPDDVARAERALQWLVERQAS